MQGENGFACSSCCGNDVPRPILFFVAARKNGSACRGRRGNDLPRPILIFFAATENGFACSGCRDNDLPRPILFFVAAKENGPPTTVVAATKSAADSNLRCNEEEWFRLQFIHKDS